MSENLMPMNNSMFLQNETDLLEQERKCYAMIERQHLLETQLRESLFQMQEIMLVKFELERTLESERRELSDTKSQLNLLQNGMQKWEQERFNARDTSVKQTLQLESLTEEKNSLREQMKNLEVENMKLKFKMQEIEKQLFSQKLIEQMIETKKSSLNSIFENIYSQNRKLETEQRLLKKNFSIAKTLGEQMTELLKLHHEAMNKVYLENSALKEKQASLSAKLDSLTGKNTSELKFFSNMKCRNEDHIKEFESMITSLDHRINEEIEERKKLNETLQIMLKEQTKFHELEEKLKDRIRRLEERLDSPVDESQNLLFPSLHSDLKDSK